MATDEQIKESTFVPFTTLDAIDYKATDVVQPLQE